MKRLTLLLGTFLLFSAFAYADVICESQVPCIFTGQLPDGRDCSQSTCPGYMLSTDSSTTATLIINIYREPGCSPDTVVRSTDPLMINFDAGGPVLLITGVAPPDQCPQGITINLGWNFAGCEQVCANYICQSAQAPMNCSDVTGGVEAPIVVLDSASN